MFYVYVLQSLSFPENFYIGFTCDLQKRLQDHNSGYSPYTKKFIPWALKNYIAFDNEQKAIAFEKYLKTHSGRKFCKNHF
jgi:predicted GIY-YIG superfamily endonuclease